MVSMNKSKGSKRKIKEKKNEKQEKSERPGVSKKKHREGYRGVGDVRNIAQCNGVGENQRREAWVQGW